MLIIGGDGQPARRRIGPQAPPLTTTINKILQRYPEGGQILKVYHTLVSVRMLAIKHDARHDVMMQSLLITDQLRLMALAPPYTVALTQRYKLDLVTGYSKLWTGYNLPRSVL